MQPTLPICFVLSQTCQVAAANINAIFLSPNKTPQALHSTWRNPADTLAVLLIIGGDVIQKALAQLSGSRLVPVAFSFGWVAYSFGTLMSVAGDGRLMPPPEYPAKVINAENGFTRDNKSWVLARLLRDFEGPLDDNVGLSVTVFAAVGGDAGKEAGVPSVDWCWASGIVVMVLQLSVAAVPWALHQDWGIFLASAAGTALALVTGALPQWKAEKWACERNSGKVVSLTGGNGSRHVMVIIGRKKGLDLEDMAVSESPRMRRRVKEEGAKKHQGRTWMIKGMPATLWITRLACLALALLWIVFLITVTGLRQNSWYLLAVGGIGMIQNVVVAGARRNQSTSGIHLERIEEFRQEKVMDTLMDLETAYKAVGQSLVDEFFPKSQRPEEKEWWGGQKDRYNSKRARDRPRSLFSHAVSPRAARARKEHEQSMSNRPKITQPSSCQGGSQAVSRPAFNDRDRSGIGT